MSDLQYCKPCQKLFSGEVQPRAGNEWSFVHHPDAESLKESLQLPCILCSQAWGRTFEGQEISSGTWGRFSYVVNNSESGMRELYFGCSVTDEWSQTMALVPWQGIIPLSYQLPPFLSQRTDSPSALEFIISRFRECIKKHNECRRQERSNSPGPSRLIDIGGPRSKNIRICDTQNLAGKEPYICLSYCWGKTQELMLTKSTEQTLRNGVLVSTLAKTFQDAILISKQLGIRYLWIDSLCIFQDNMSEWEIEASRMGSIYSHSTCTIAATSAKDSEGGLFFDRDPKLLRPLCLDFTRPTKLSIDDSNVKTMDALKMPSEGRYWCESRSAWSGAVETAPLNSRAWVAQERYLSPRIMHFTNRQLSWECHKCMASENYQEGLPEWAYPNWKQDPSSLKRYVHQLGLYTSSPPWGASLNIAKDLPLDVKRKIYHEWRCFRIHYSVCKMTKEDDKLVAFQGIAQNLGFILGDKLVAGLWRDHFLEDLCWYKHPLINDPPPWEPTAWRAPTWSWASSNERIWVSDTSKWHNACPERQIWGELHDLDVESYASGKLARATVRIRCRPIRASILINSRFKYRAYGNLTLTRSTAELQAISTSTAMNLYLDNQGRTGVDNVHIVIIQRCAHETIPDDHSHVQDVVEGLLIVPEAGSVGVFKRLGLFKAMDNVNVDKILGEYEAAEEQVITLI